MTTHSRQLVEELFPVVQVAIDANAAQYWGLHLSVNGPIRSKIPVKCVHDHGNGNTDGTPVELYDCNGTSAQNSTLPGDDTIRINDKCLDISFIGTHNEVRGSPLRMPRRRGCTTVGSRTGELDAQSQLRPLPR